MNEIFMIYSSFASKDEAARVARTLLDKRLIACANIVENITPIYRWQGKLQESSEVLMLAKTQEKKLSAAIDAIKEMHSYDLPCIVAYPAEDGFAPFMQWVRDETNDLN